MSTNEKLTSFSLDGQDKQLEYIETLTVKDGVKCDTYAFVGDDSKDVAIVRVEQGSKTPLQRIVSGVTTIEGHVSGEATLRVRHKDGNEESFVFSDGAEHTPVTVQIGDVMQWHANGATPLVFYEVCEPAYQDGRFENLAED